MGAAPLDEPMRDSGPVPKDQLRKLADMFISDMGMTPDEVLQKPEFVEQGITDLAQLEESKMRITEQQLRRIIREEKRKLFKEFDTSGRVGQSYEAAESLLYKHAEEVAADPYGFVDVLETAAQIVKDEQRGSTR